MFQQPALWQGAVGIFAINRRKYLSKFTAELLTLSKCSKIVGWVRALELAHSNFQVIDSGYFQIISLFQSTGTFANRTGAAPAFILFFYLKPI